MMRNISRQFTHLTVSLTPHSPCKLLTKHEQILNVRGKYIKDKEMNKDSPMQDEVERKREKSGEGIH